MRGDFFSEHSFEWPRRRSLVGVLCGSQTDNILAEKGSKSYKYFVTVMMQSVPGVGHFSF